MILKPRRYSRIPTNPLIEAIGLHATAPGELLPTGLENQVVETAASRCSAQDPGRSRIDGWFLPDHICGRTGRDLIHPGDGRDVVEAGAGNDVIYANHDHWSRDRISCGRGRDVVVADPRDRVAKDCEKVVRR